MNRAILILIAFAAVFSYGCTNAAAPVAVSNRPVSINDVRQPDVPTKAVADMKWTGMDGTTQRIADHSGKVLILDFWATYCPPCIEETPHLNSLREKYGPDKLEVIGLNVGGDDDRPKIPDFIKNQKIGYPIAFPEDALLNYISGDDDRIPQTAVFNKKGDLVLKVVGYDPAVKGQIDIAVESAISQ
jgi:cytochrome c-type biogenesis protein